jgi:hypothetical protein
MPIDPTQIDSDALLEAANDTVEFWDNYNKDRESQQIIQEKEEDTEEKAEQIQADPRNAEKWGLKAVAEEFKSIGLS